jgi:hypothetical protein
MKDFLIPVFTFFAGLFSGLVPHVQKPLTDYRKALSDISATILANAVLMYGDSFNTGSGDSRDKHNAELRKLYNDLRIRRAKLLSSSGTIPRFARRPLQLLELLRSPTQISEGAQMPVGISNQLVSPNKDLSHLTKLIERLGTMLDINVDQ